ncbi:UNVERIFIED_CONTAM: hypothetical protein Sradi_4201000 [Sesamum radiatum]|uniref:Uncharacterized protein n=1 Tax=Sesamum radiatum TaxID=300843 RepID=A0AAW2P4N5_SESRA
MEKLLNHYDREYMKMAMLKHEETFREQVYELHRLYQIQKMLMKDIAKNKRKDPQYGNNCKQPEARLCLDLERPAEEFNAPESGGAGKCRVSETEDDQGHDLELTLGPRSYRRSKLTKAADPPSDSGRSFSSSSTGSVGKIWEICGILCIMKSRQELDSLSLRQLLPRSGAYGNGNLSPKIQRLKSQSSSTTNFEKRRTKKYFETLLLMLYLQNAFLT